jgi:regulator of extracellular matrix RemA (YlzA/DUF370 family)
MGGVEMDNEHGMMMVDYLLLPAGGVIATMKIVAIARADSAPVRRLLREVGEGNVVNLTFGQPRRSVVIMETGHLIITALSPVQLLRRLTRQQFYANKYAEAFGET